MAEIWKLPDRERREEEPERPHSRSARPPDEMGSMTTSRAICFADRSRQVSDRSC
jgi:hypothetical protein